MDSTEPFEQGIYDSPPRCLRANSAECAAVVRRVAQRTMPIGRREDWPSIAVAIATGPGSLRVAAIDRGIDHVTLWRWWCDLRDALAQDEEVMAIADAAAGWARAGWQHDDGKIMVGDVNLPARAQYQQAVGVAVDDEQALRVFIGLRWRQRYTERHRDDTLGADGRAEVEPADAGLTVVRGGRVTDETGRVTGTRIAIVPKVTLAGPTQGTLTAALARLTVGQTTERIGDTVKVYDGAAVTSNLRAIYVLTVTGETAVATGRIVKLRPVTPERERKLAKVMPVGHGPDDDGLWRVSGPTPTGWLPSGGDAISDPD